MGVRNRGRLRWKTALGDEPPCALMTSYSVA
jgi:hypothetical protein